jgi:hypothetical protein
VPSWPMLQQCFILPLHFSRFPGGAHAQCYNGCIHSLMCSLVAAMFFYCFTLHCAKLDNS